MVDISRTSSEEEEVFFKIDTFMARVRGYSTRAHEQGCELVNILSLMCTLANQNFLVKIKTFGRQKEGSFIGRGYRKVFVHSVVVVARVGRAVLKQLSRRRRRRRIR